MEKSRFFDPDLPASAACGNERAYAEIIHYFFPIIKNMAAGYYLSGGDRDDLIQEGLIGLYGAVRSFDKEKNDSFVTYAKLCIHRAMINAIKNDNRKKNAALNQSVSLEDEQPVLHVDPADIVLSRQNFTEFYARIEHKLSAFEKQVLELYLDGYSYKQIGDKLGKSAKSVDNATRRIRTKLKSLHACLW